MIEVPFPSDLPGRPGEQRDLHRILKTMGVRIDELGRLNAARDDKIRWLEAEVSRLAAVVQGLEDTRIYQQTGRPPGKRKVYGIEVITVGEVK